MNKMLTGAIAISASALLLVGGGGTLAMWNVEKTIDPGTITAGKLVLDAKPGTWTVRHGDLAPVTYAGSISEHVIVPGDVLTYTQKLNIDLEGTNIAAQLSANFDEIENSLADDVDFSWADVDVDYNLFEGRVPVTSWSKAFPAYFEEDKSFTSQFVFSFPYNEGITTTASAGATLDLGPIQFTLKQVMKTPPPAPAATTTVTPTTTATP